MKEHHTTRDAKPVAIWIRVSTQEQAEGVSPEHHEARARMYAKAKGWEVIDLYDLSAVSGKTVKEHPEAKRMLADVESGRIHGLIFSKLARLARNTRELLDFAEFFREHDADLISLHESIDTSSPAGRLFYTVIAAMAEWEREEIAERVRASVSVRAKLGKPLGGAAPFGYRWDDGILVLEPTEAPIRKLMYSLFHEKNHRVKTVADRLNEMGHRTRKGAKFTHTTVHRLLTDPISKGKRRINATRSLGEGKKWERKPESEWSWVDVPAIVTEDEWAAVNTVLDERRRKREARPPKKARQLFTGVTFCTCGTKMYKLSNTPKYVCKKCRTKIPVDTLETVFREQLQGFVLSEDQVVAYLERSDQVLSEKRDLLTTTEGERTRLGAEMDKLYRLYQDGGIGVDGFRDRHSPIEERHRQISEEIPRLQSEIDVHRIGHLDSAHLIGQARDLYTRWDSLDFEEKRSIIELMVRKIVIGKSDISFDISYLPAAST